MQSTTVEGMSMTDRQFQCGLTISPVFSQFVEDELLPAIGLSPGDFWPGLESIIADLSPVNRALLDKRDEIQQQIDDWHLRHQDDAWRHEEYVDY